MFDASMTANLCYQKARFGVSARTHSGGSTWSDRRRYIVCHEAKKSRRFFLLRFP